MNSSNSKKQSVWFYACIALAVALVIAITAIVVISLTSNRSPEDPGKNPPSQIMDGPETGVYYYDVAGGEILLSFNSGNKFTIAGPEINKSGDYTVNGEIIDLDFVRDEDGTATAMYNGDTVTLSYGDATMTFLRKTYFNIFFEVNGGNAMSAIKVLNGKAASKPSDPTKDDNVFLGWYTDAELTAPYSFETSAVTADITLYARWAPKTAAQEEFKVKLSLNYEGAGEAVEMITTGARLYDIPAPERQGYSFCGWYVSMYENGDKLTYAYEDGMIFTADTTLFAVWSDDSSDLLPSPAVSIIGSSASWEAIEGASRYQVTVTDEKGTVIVSEPIGSTTYTVNFNSLPAGSYSVAVTALSTDASKNSEPAVRYYNNKALDRVSSIQVIDNILIFKSVDNAEKYLITVDCGNDLHKHTLFNNGTSTSFSLANCPMQKGGIRITVTASANGYASSVSKEFVYDRTLDSIENLGYDSNTDTFVWNTVTNAAGYTVTVTVGNETYTFDNGNKTSFSVAYFTGDISVAVTPVNSGFNSPEASSASCKKTVPPVPSGITLNGNLLTWNAVEGATSYEVKVGSKTYNTEVNSFNLTNAELTSAAVNEICIKTVKGNESSAFSEPFSFGYNVFPGDLVYKNNNVYWTPAFGINNFEVRVNGGVIKSVSNTDHTRVTLTRAGINTVEVRYTDNGGCDWISIEVFAFEITYMSRSMNGETTEYVAIGDTLTPPTDFTNAGYVFGGWYNTPAASAGNGTKYESFVFTGNCDMVLYADWIPQTFKIELSTDGYDIDNIEANTSCDVVYTNGYILPVPTSNNASFESFVGWYTGPSGSGIKLTDESGRSVSNYPYTHDTVAYPYFNSNVLSFELRNDNTYAVSAGVNFDSVSHVSIPYTYNGLPVSIIVENAFKNHTQLVSIDIPDSIELVGIGAFTGTSKLKSINVYKVEGNHVRNYSSYEGALIRHDYSDVFLEAFPRAKTGEYVIPDYVTAIRNKAFQYSNISKVTIAKSVTTIQDSAFWSCRALSSVVFEGGRTTNISIPAKMFYNCASLTSIRFPANVKDINIQMFIYIPNIMSIEVEDGGRFYGSINGMLTNAKKDKLIYAPYTVSGEYTVPEAINYIENSAFQGRKNLTKIVIPKNVLAIGDNAFSDCINVTEIVFEGKRVDNLDIGTRAFAGCTKLKTVTFEGSGSDTPCRGSIAIGNYAFAPSGSSTVPNLQNLIFKKGVNVRTVGDYAFADQTDLDNIVFEDNVIVSSIGVASFKNNILLDHIDIPSSTTSIGESAFEGCVRAAYVNFIEGGNEINFGANAFKGCTSITSVKLPSTTKQFIGSAFSGCSQLAAIEVSKDNPNLASVNGVLYEIDENRNPITLLFYPMMLDASPNALAALPWNTLTALGDAVFEGNTKVTEFTITDKIKSIGKNAFASCTNLKKVIKVGDSGEFTLGEKAFYNCSTLDTIQIPASVTEIPSCAFYGCNFADFDIPEGVTSIGASAFSNNFALTAINIPANVNFIGSKAFYACTNLSDVNIAESDTVITLGVENDISQAFSSCGMLKSIDLKSRFAEIPAQTFKSSGLTSIDLTGVTTIGDQAFESSRSLASVIVPNTVTYIGNSAFHDATSLTDISFLPGGTESLDFGDKVFYGASALENITLPARIGNIYRVGAWDGSQPYSYKPYDEETTSYTIRFKNFFTQFYGASKLKNIFVDEGSDQYCSINGVLYEKDSDGTPHVLLFCPVMNEGEMVNGVPTVVVPSTVMFVENFAFQDIKNIQAVIFEELDENSVYYGQSILTIGNGLLEDTSNSVHVFGGDSSNTISKIVFPSHLAYIGPSAIGSTKSLSVTINPNTKNLKIARNAFANSKITELKLYGVAELGTGAFYSTTMISTSKNAIQFINSTLTSIPSSLFLNSKIRYFTVPASVKTLAEKAFNGANSLKEIYFEKDSQLTRIGPTAFDPYINNIDFSNVSKLSIIDEQAFLKCSKLTSFTLPETIIAIGNHAFQGCTGITSLVLNSGATADLLYSEDHTGVISIFDDLTSLKTISINGEGKELIVDDGVIYNKDKTILYYFPAFKDPTGFTIPSTVKVIGDSAFYGFTGTSITFPEGLEAIGTKAFQNSKITSIHIPASVRSIGSSAFANCKSVTSITFDPNCLIDTIRSNTFFGNSAVTTLLLPDSVRVIENAAFSNYNNLKELRLPASVESVGDQAFSNCLKLEKLELNNKLQTIGVSAFSSMIRLKELNIPASVVTIGEGAFTSMWALEKLAFAPNSQLQSIGKNAFNNTQNLVSIILPAGVTSIGESAFENSSALVSIALPAGLVEIPNNLFKNSPKLETVNIPDRITAIGASAFAGTMIKSVIIPDTVASIGIGAFENCKALTEVTFGANNLMLDIQSGVFKGTDALETVVLPTGLQTIAESAFENSGIMTIALPASLKTISNRAFYNCDRLESIAIFGNVSHIGGYAFYDCKVLKSAELSFGLSHLGDYAFAYCNSLENANIPASTEFLGVNPFFKCELISSITVDSESTFFTMDNGAIYDISKRTLYYYPASNNAEHVVLPETLREIKMSAFYGAKMKSVTIPANVNRIEDYTFQNCINLESVIGGEGINYIGNYAFENCVKLESITLYNGLTMIDDYAFYGCESLDNIVIPKTALTLGNYVFANCSSLSNIRFEETGSHYVIGTHFFENCTSMTEVVLPLRHQLGDEDIQKYGLSNNWDNNVTAAKVGAIPSYMFAGTGIVNAILPESVTWLGTEGVFMNCKQMESISFRGTLKYETIGDHFFDGCSKIESISIPQGGNRVLSNYTFANCTSLKYITIYYQNEPIEASHTFENCASLTQLTWYRTKSGSQKAGNRGMKYVGPYFFAGCTSLPSIKLENGAAIHEYAFDGCTSLETLNIVNSDKASGAKEIASIGDYAFRNCTGMSRLIFNFNFPPIVGQNVFEGWTADQLIGFGKDNALSLKAYVLSGTFNGCKAQILDMNGTPVELDA